MSHAHAMPWTGSLRCSCGWHPTDLQPCACGHTAAQHHPTPRSRCRACPQCQEFNSTDRQCADCGELDDKHYAWCESLGTF